MPTKTPWFRLYSETRTDQKIKRIATLTQQPKYAILGIWTALLTLAGESPERGKILISYGIPMTFNEIIDEIGLDSGLGKVVIGAFIDLNMLHLEDETYTISNWDNRQFSSDTSAERVRKYRETKKVPSISHNSNEQIEPPCNVTVTPPDTESYTESDIDSTPNGVGEKSPQKPKKDNSQEQLPEDDKPPGPLKQLMGVFQSESNLKLPHKKAQVGYWWSTIREIYELVDHDVGQGQEIIRQSIKKLRAEHLTIGGPESLVKTCRALASGQDLAQKGQPTNGQHKQPESKPDPRDPAQWASMLESQSSRPRDGPSASSGRGPHLAGT